MQFWPIWTSWRRHRSRRAIPFVGWNVNSPRAAGSFACNGITKRNQCHWLKCRRNWVGFSHNHTSNEWPNIHFSILFSDREAATFVHIAQFCNFMNENHSANGVNSDSNVDQTVKTSNRPNVVTLLTGDRLSDKKSSNFSFTGIMNAMSIKFEQIGTFYGKYKKKWTHAPETKFCGMSRKIDRVKIYFQYKDIDKSINKGTSAGNKYKTKPTNQLVSHTFDDPIDCNQFAARKLQPQKKTKSRTDRRNQGSRPLPAMHERNLLCVWGRGWKSNQIDGRNGECIRVGMLLLENDKSIVIFTNKIIIIIGAG